MNYCQICNKEIPKRYTESVKKYNTHVVCSRICYREWIKLPEQRLTCGKSNIGNKYNLGKHHTDKTKAIISKTHKGKIISEETREKMSLNRKGIYPKSFIGLPVWNKGKKCPHITGEKHHNWKGGATPEYAKIRTSMEYLNWRKDVFHRDCFTCQECGIKNGLGKTIKLNADHIKPFCLYPELRLDINNGRTLCESCHRKTDTYGMRGIMKYKKNLTYTVA